MADIIQGGGEEPAMPSANRRGPFAVDPVDPLVYQERDDSPELRPAASYIAVGPQIRAKTPKPVQPQNLSYQKWTPGGLSEANTQPSTQVSVTGKVAAGLLRLLMFLAPILLVAAGVWVAFKI